MFYMFFHYFTELDLLSFHSGAFHLTIYQFLFDTTQCVDTLKPHLVVSADLHWLLLEKVLLREDVHSRFAAAIVYMKNIILVEMNQVFH